MIKSKKNPEKEDSNAVTASLKEPFITMESTKVKKCLEISNKKVVPALEIYANGKI